MTETKNTTQQTQQTQDTTQDTTTVRDRGDRDGAPGRRGGHGRGPRTVRRPPGPGRSEVRLGGPGHLGRGAARRRRRTSRTLDIGTPDAAPAVAPWPAGRWSSACAAWCCSRPAARTQALPAEEALRASGADWTVLRAPGSTRTSARARCSTRCAARNWRSRRRTGCARTASRDARRTSRRSRCGWCASRPGGTRRVRWIRPGRSRSRARPSRGGRGGGGDAEAV